MIFGVLLILIGLFIAAPVTLGSGTDFHLFAALNIIGLGAICCTIAHYLKPILDELRSQHRPAPRTTSPTPDKVTRPRQSDWDKDVAAARDRRF